MVGMDDTEFDRVLIAAAFARAGQHGWRRLSVVQVARDVGLPLDRARARFPGTAAVLMRFGLMADQAALSGVSMDGSERDRLFDMVMRRVDVLQAHRAGVLALLRWLPTRPVTAALLSAANLRSMAWMLEAAGVPATGLLGVLRAEGMLAVWLWTVRAWRDDESDDLPATMAALDRALDRAEQAEASLSGFFRRPPQAEVPPPAFEPVSDVPPPAPLTPDVPPTAPGGDFDAE